MAVRQKDYNLLSLSAESCKIVENKFDDLDEANAKALFSDILKAIKEVTEKDKIDSLRNLSILLKDISKSKNYECLKNYHCSDRNENFNLVSLACRNKAIKALNYILSEKPQILYDLSAKCTGVSKNQFLLSVPDEFRHNAFYYAIRSNMTDLLSILIDKWPSKSSDGDLDDLLSQSYKELKLRNVPLTREMQIFVESKILDFRFFHVSAGKNSGTGNSWEQIKKRIEFVIKHIRIVKNDYWEEDPDDKFMLLAESIAKGIHVLKSLLKSTYDRLPWEEIEFCLTIFIGCCKNSSRQNLVYNCVLNKKQMLIHLFNFANILDTQYHSYENNNVIQLSKSVNLPRDTVIDNIKKNWSEFCKLYDDFEKVRDFCSLETIKSYASLIKSGDDTQKRKYLLFSRVLQVMGEHLKNTLDSPKLSTKTANALLSCLSLETRDTLTKLRDSLSHEEFLFIRSEIEKKTYLFKNIHTNISRINEMIPDMLHAMGIESVKVLMKKLKLCDGPGDFSKCFGPYRRSFNLYSEEIQKTSLITGDFERFEELLQFLDKYINKKEVLEKMLYERIDLLIKEEKERFENLNQVYNRHLKNFLLLNFFASLKNFDDCFWTMAKVTEGYILYEESSKETKEIGELVKELFRIVIPRVLKSSNMEPTLRKHLFFLNSEMGSIKCIKELGEIIKENKMSIMSRNNNKKSQETSISHNLSENLFAAKFSKLEELINFNLKDGISSKQFSLFESDKEFQAVLEMLVLDILCLLENSFSRNPFYLDSGFPVITGKNLRNHLAHGNALIDVCFEENNVQLLINAKKILCAISPNNNKKLDKVIKCDSTKLESSIEYDLEIISSQQNLFSALEKGDMTGVENCVKKGADVYGRDCNLSTCLHFAGKAPGCTALDWVLKQGFDITSKDSFGQTVLHTASKFNRIEVIQYLLEHKQMPLDFGDHKEEIPLQFVGKVPDIQALKFILMEDFCMKSMKSADEIVSTIASSFKTAKEKQYWKHILLGITDAKGKSPLHVAVGNQNNEVVAYISSEINTTVKDSNKLYALLLAIEVHNTEAAEILLAKEANVNEIKYRLNFTPLHLAAMSGNSELVKLLIARKHRIDPRNEFGMTPLHLITITQRNIEIVKALVENGADVNAKDEAGVTPLINAATFGNLEITTFLLRNGADVNVVDCNQFTPLLRAALFGNVADAGILLEKGAFVNCKEIAGFTPLHAAAMKNHYKVVELLLKHGAEIDCKNDADFTALHFSSALGHKEIAELLIKRGADVNATESTKRTPLHEAASHRHIEIVNLLIKEGADINHRDENGFTALHCAAFVSDRGIVESLLKKGADIRVNAANNITPMRLLISRRLSDLLTPEARDVHSSDLNGFTLLHAAAEFGDRTLVEYCIENGCDVNARSGSGFTALHLASQANHSEIVSLLLRNRAELDPENDDGSTPLLAAIRNNSTEAVEVLVSHEVQNFKPIVDDKISALKLSVFCGWYKIVDILLQNFKFDISDKIKKDFFDTAIYNDNKHLLVTLLKRGFEINGYARPLHCAAFYSRHYMAELLLINGANLNILDENNRTPLYTAIYRRDAEMVEILLSEKAKIPIENKFIIRAAAYAVLRNQLDMVKKLLQLKVINVNSKGNDSHTFLHFSALGGSLDMTKYLVSEGGDINAKNKFGCMPVHIAACRGFKDVVEFYLNLTDLADETKALLLVAASNGKADVCGMLLERHFCQEDDEYLGLSLVNDDKEVLSVLLHNGAFYNAPLTLQLAQTVDNDAISLLRKVKNLFTAVQNNSVAEVENLLRELSNPKYCLANAKCVKKETVLHYASWKGYEKVVDVLLKYKTSPNSRTKTGETPLHYAVKNSHSNIVKALLANGAIYDALSDKGKTPLDYATDKKIRDCILFLKYIFNKVLDNNPSVLENLRGKDKDILRAVVKAKDREGKTLIDVAHIHSFSKTIELELMFQTDILTELNQLKKLVMEKKIEEAASVHECLIHKKAAIFGADSEPVLAVKESLGRIFQMQWNLNKARPLFMQTYDIRRKNFGENHLKTLLSEYSIALLLSKEGKTSEAVQIFEKLHPRLKEKLEPDSQKMICFEISFCSALFHMEKYDETLRLGHEIQQKCQKSNPLYQIMLTDALYNTAKALTKQRRLSEALKLFITVYETRKNIFKLRNSLTLRALSMIADVLAMLDLLDESLKIFEEVLDIKKSFLPQNNFEILMSEFCVGGVLFKQAKILTALKIFLSLEPKIAAVAPNSDLMKANKVKLEEIKNYFTVNNVPITVDSIKN